ncbi:Heat shock protein GrpE [Moraxella catarrhalis]|nr:Heat shock protein GrpE [Moraxella catarrhalis]
MMIPPSRPHRSLRKIVQHQFVQKYYLHDRTGRLEKCLKNLFKFQTLHDRTGRLEIGIGEHGGFISLHDRTGRLEI